MKKFGLVVASATILTGAMAISTAPAGAQPVPQVPSEYFGQDPIGKVSYSLPMTTFTFEVTAVRETFHAGPYAKYASKYLGIEARQRDAVTHTITDLKMITNVEADQQRRFIADAEDGALRTMLLKLSSQGLISDGTGNPVPDRAWKFPVASASDFSDKGVSSNLTTEAATLYQSVKKESNAARVPVQQSMVVEKSPELRAEEAANMIFEIRDQRLKIVTGDTDATYSGEAMASAIAELTRLENEYMSLFIGYSDYQTQKLSFDLVPEKNRDTQLYIPFRISDTEGVVSADNISGRPVIMEILPQEVQQPVLEKKDAKSAKKLPYIVYRVPAVCTVKLSESGNTLMQARVPIYQMGLETTLPVVTSKK